MGTTVKVLRPHDFNFGEDWEDAFVEIKNIRKNDVIFECFKGENHKLVALTSARRISDGYYVVVSNENNEVGEMFYSNCTSYPPPNLFREPQYLTEVNKKLVYIIE